MDNKRSTIKKGTIKRILSYLGNYKKTLLLVFICIIISSVTGVLGSLFLKSLIDDYISPMLINNSNDYSNLLNALIKISSIYLFGVITNYTYSILMTKTSQGVLRDIRDEMFSKMERLPIRYFDTNKHGDIMSRYTNDTDSLRQMIAQSLPNLVASLMTIIAVLVSMFLLNVYLTLFVIIFTILTIFITRHFAKNSAKYFIKSRTSLGKVNAYIEEMLNGQKVIKVFNHEDTAIKEFDKLNNDLNKVSFNADKFATIVMPIAGNLGYLEYALVALISTYLVINGYALITVGTIISFLNLTRSFQQPVNQITNQLNSIIMALAGAGRIFDLMDSEAEVDDGYVTLTKVIEKDALMDSMHGVIHIMMEHLLMYLLKVILNY